ncbi:Cullin-associated and neddylation-dissociated 1 [Carabus blaptoides fortunei]
MASVSYQIANLLEKMTSTDKDFRFMATNDLMSELQKDSIKLDDDSERKVVRMLLRLLEDKNGEVQNLAVKCLGPLVNKVKEYQVETIVDSLCANMISDKEQLRDISSIGLKTVISELPLVSSSLAANVCKRITGRLSSAIEKQEDVSVQLEALDILADLLSRFGGLLVSFHTVILNALLPQLRSPRQAVRKRTIVALSHLVLSCNPALYDKLIDYLIEGLSSNVNTSTTRTIIQCIAAICRQAGHRFGEHIERIVPLIVTYTYEDDDELREHCLQAFEAFVHRCPKEITPHIGTITSLCMKYITYDPNYNYDDDGEDGDDGNMETEEEAEDDENDEYSDDDDMSWKVRRSAAKCLEAVISTRHELLPEFYKNVSPALIARFKEREENVKSDIFHAYVAMLRQTKSTAAVTFDPESMEHEELPVCMLQSQVPAVVRALQSQIKDKSIKTRQDCFNLLQELIAVLPGAMSNHMPVLISGIQYSLGDKNSSSNMKIDTLIFVHCLLSSHPPEVFHPHMGVLIAPVIAAVNDPFYKITAEALLVLQQLVKDEAVPILGSFLRKNQRALKLSTLSLLDTLVQNYSHYLYTDLLRSVISEVPPLLSEADLHIAQLTLVLLTSIARVYSGALVDVSDTILPEILVLVKSPLLQGAALDAMLEFFQALVGCRLPGLGYHDVLKLLVRPVAIGSPAANLHKQAFHSLAKCVAAITVIFEHEALPVVEQFMKDVGSANNDAQHVFALLVIGEIGRHIDLSSVGTLKQVILNSFSNVSEEVKSAASYTLGSVSIVLQRLDRLVEPLRVTCTMKVKANSVKQEYEKQDELKRSAMRAVVTLLTIPDADKNPHLSEFVSQIKSATDLQPIFESIQKDTSGLMDCFLMDQS